MPHFSLIFALGALVASTPATARVRPEPGTPAQVARLLACRSVSEAAQRLACFDRETGAMAAAVANKDLVVVDRQRASAARRSLFGFSVPNFGGLFGSSDQDDIKQIAGKVESAGRNGDGGWTIVLSDGSTWTQSDGTPLALAPRRGDAVIVQRGALGSFYLRLGRQPGIKVRRTG